MRWPTRQYISERKHPRQVPEQEIPLEPMDLIKIKELSPTQLQDPVLKITMK